MTIKQDKKKQLYIMKVENSEAFVSYTIKDNIMFLNHAEVPYELRGKGIGKLLVESTFSLLTEQGYKATAICSYVRTIARRSPKWSKIITDPDSFDSCSLDSPSF